MPFAVVDGEPVTELPQDLYIPPYALQVFLEAFEGPLDLLLYLIRRQNIDILDIPIAEITRQYVEYIELMTEMQLELAGEYLLMAAMLAEIKSRMLLPRPETEEEEEEDPRAELVRRLQEYERFKKAAEDLSDLPRLERDVRVAVGRCAGAQSHDQAARRDAEGIVARVPRCAQARGDVLEPASAARTAVGAPAHVGNPHPDQGELILPVLATCSIRKKGRMGVAVTFIAILELLRESLIEVVQAEAYAALHVRGFVGPAGVSTTEDGEPVQDEVPAEGARLSSMSYGR